MPPFRTLQAPEPYEAWMKNERAHVLYHRLAIMETETQKGRDNFVSHHCLIKLLVEKYLHEVTDMTWEEFLNIVQFRPKHVRGQPQPRRVSREVRATEVTLGASTSGANPSSNPPIAEQAIEIDSSESKYLGEESSSSDSNDNAPAKTTIRTRATLRREEAQMREAEMRKGKAKKQVAEKSTLGPRK